MKFTLSLKQAYSKRKKNQELGLPFTPLHYDTQTRLRLMAQKAPWDTSGCPKAERPRLPSALPPAMGVKIRSYSLFSPPLFSCSQNTVRANFFQAAFPWPCGSSLGITAASSPASSSPTPTLCVSTRCPCKSKVPQLGGLTLLRQKWAAGLKKPALLLALRYGSATEAISAIFRHCYLQNFQLMSYHDSQCCFFN